MAQIKSFRQRRILDKALAIFWDKGYNGTSMQDLVIGLGLSGPAYMTPYVISITCSFNPL